MWAETVFATYGRMTLSRAGRRSSFRRSRTKNLLPNGIPNRTRPLHSYRIRSVDTNETWPRRLPPGLFFHCIDVYTNRDIAVESSSVRGGIDAHQLSLEPCAHWGAEHDRDPQRGEEHRDRSAADLSCECHKGTRCRLQPQTAVFRARCHSQ